MHLPLCETCGSCWAAWRGLGVWLSTPRGRVATAVRLSPGVQLQAVPMSSPRHWPPPRCSGLAGASVKHPAPSSAAERDPLPSSARRDEGKKSKRRAGGVSALQPTVRAQTGFCVEGNSALLSDSDPVRCCSKTCRQQPLHPPHTPSPVLPARDSCQEPAACHPVTRSLGRVEITAPTFTRKRSGSFSEQNHSILPTAL